MGEEKRTGWFVVGEQGGLDLRTVHHVARDDDGELTVFFHGVERYATYDDPTGEFNKALCATLAAIRSY